MYKSIAVVYQKRKKTKKGFKRDFIIKNKCTQNFNNNKKNNNKTNRFTFTMRFNKRKKFVSNLIPTILQNVKLGNNWLRFFLLKSTRTKFRVDG